ncbi:putative membrane protein [Elusimicrobium posterum]|uniref:DUF2157 domain-containing protein n=1 Tax=Elusimicrobium posterum TaxID=3116653 RepID=UPI003C74C547
MSDISKKQIDSLYQKNLISYRDYLGLIQKAAPVDWGAWLGKNLLFLSAALFIAGVIFFFAYNWFILPKFAKLAGAAALFVLSALGVWRKGLDTNAGQAFGFAACFFTGAFLAVFGQVYQTGANAFDLFFGWMLLILPFALIINKTSVWTLFVVLANVAFFLYPNPHKEPWMLYLINIIFAVAAKLPFEITKQQTYFYYLLNLYITFIAGAVALHYPLISLYSVIPLSWILLMFFYYFKKGNIHFIALSVFLTAFWLLMKFFNFFDLRSYFLIALIILAVSVAAGFTLLIINNKIKNRRGANA